MRITIVQGAFFPVPPLRGGAVEKLWHRLAIEFAAQGNEVRQISRRVPELPAESIEQGVLHRRVKGYDQPASIALLKWRDLCYTMRAIRGLKRSGVVVTNTFWAPLLLGKRKGPVYISVERMPKGQMRLYRKAARFRACSSAVADAIRREVPHLAEKVRMVPNPLPRQPKDPVDWSRKEKSILFVGRIHPAKGIDLLIKAFAIARTHSPRSRDWQLLIVGPEDAGRGGGGEAWARSVRASTSQESVRWLGPIYDPDQLDALYHSASLFAYPSVDAMGEAMPVAPLEAMAWGAVPVLSQLQCFSDYAVHGQNCFQFNHLAPSPPSELAAVLNTAMEQDLRRLAIAATAVRETHSPAAIATQFLQDFASLSDSQAT